MGAKGIAAYPDQARAHKLLEGCGFDADKHTRLLDRVDHKLVYSKVRDAIVNAYTVLLRKGAAAYQRRG